MFSHFLLRSCLCLLHMVQREERREKLCFTHVGFSTVKVTLCLRYSMYWFPRYNISFRQSLSGCQGQAVYQDPNQDHISNLDKEGGLTRRRVLRRSSSEIASTKIAGRSIPSKVRRSRLQKVTTKHKNFHCLPFFPLVTLCCC